MQITSLSSAAWLPFSCLAVRHDLLDFHFYYFFLWTSTTLLKLKNKKKFKQILSWLVGSFIFSFIIFVTFREDDKSKNSFFNYLMFSNIMINPTYSQKIAFRLKENGDKSGFIVWLILYKVGGLDGRDQSRSRSRTSMVSRLTFENCRDYPSCRDQLFFLSRLRFLKLRFFNWDLTLSRYLLRSSRYIETIETNRDYWDFLRFIEISWQFWEIFTNRQLWKVTSFHRCLLVKWIKSSNLDRDLWKL
jgi:hypothetical protein